MFLGRRAPVTGTVFTLGAGTPGQDPTKCNWKRCGLWNKPSTKDNHYRTSLLSVNGREMSPQKQRAEGSMLAKVARLLGKHWTVW